MPSRRVAARPPAPTPSTVDAPPDTSPAAALASTVKDKAREQSQGLVGAVSTLWDNYREQSASLSPRLPPTSSSSQLHPHSPCPSLAAAPKLKLIDCFMLFLVLTGVIQFVYCFAVTNFPFNAFIGGCVLSLSLLDLCFFGLPELTSSSTSQLRGSRRPVRPPRRAADPEQPGEQVDLSLALA